MYLSELLICNFRQFGTDDNSLTVSFHKGVTALVGQNDCGKSTVIDAIRYALLTRDQDYIRVQPEDFHINEQNQQADEIIIRCKISDLSDAEKGTFAEYLTYADANVDLYVHWSARKRGEQMIGRRWVDISASSGEKGEGPVMEATVRALLAAAYLRPLRDAEREMSSGRGSRLSQVLASFKNIHQGELFDASRTYDSNDLKRLSLVGLHDHLKQHVEAHTSLIAAQGSINGDYLEQLKLKGDAIHSRISFSDGVTEEMRLKHLLERLELELLDGNTQASRGRYGLGSHNLLYMSCELLLLGGEPEALPLLLIEEPEAHLHPQRQLRLMQFLTNAANSDEEHNVQVIITTHSPNLASKIPLENLVMLEGSRAFPLTKEQTRLAEADYRFLQRFLDVTKANLFFAQGVVIVEGAGEAILIPTIGKLLGRDFTEYGVSIINVGGTGLRRYSRIFQRKSNDDKLISVRVACLADRDVMPDCAPAILDLVTSSDDPKWGSPKRRWKTEQDFIEDELAQLKLDIKSKNDGQNVRTFVSDHWTLEYDLAYAGLAEEVYISACLAKNDEALNDGRKTYKDVETDAKKSFQALNDQHEQDQKAICSEVYALFKRGASKAIAAQYLAERLTINYSDQPEKVIRASLPQYIVEAIGYVTEPLGDGALKKEQGNG